MEGSGSGAGEVAESVRKPGDEKGYNCGRLRVKEKRCNWLASMSCERVSGRPITNFERNDSAIASGSAVEWDKSRIWMDLTKRDCRVAEFEFGLGRGLRGMTNPMCGPERMVDCATLGRSMVFEPCANVLRIAHGTCIKAVVFRRSNNFERPLRFLDEVGVKNWRLYHLWGEVHEQMRRTSPHFYAFRDACAISEPGSGGCLRASLSLRELFKHQQGDDIWIPLRENSSAYWVVQCQFRPQ